MLTLTREVRFALPFSGVIDSSTQLHNGYAGHPPLVAAGMWLRLEVTVAGELHPQSQYLVDIQAIDRVVREAAAPFLMRELGNFAPGVMQGLHSLLSNRFRPAEIVRLTLHLTPFQSWSILVSELSMVRLSHMFEFSAAHRLHNPALTDEANRELFGKCNNALGHGHNYQVQVTLRSTPAGVLSIPELERIVDQTLIKRYDHKHLNLEVDDFQDAIASVENIAKAAFARLKPALPTLATVTVWETPKTWAEYGE